MRGPAILPWLLALLLAPAGAQAGSFFLTTEEPAPVALWMHLPNDGTPLRGGNDTTLLGYMNVRPPAQASILVGPQLGPADCAVPGTLPVSARPTWVVGVSPDRIPLPNETNYNHYHWQDTAMPFTLAGPGLELVWYAGIAPVGTLEPTAGTLSPPVTAVLQADLVVAHTEHTPGEGTTDVIDQEIATGRSEPQTLGDTPGASGGERITVDGFTAYGFTVRLDLTDGDVPSRPFSELRLVLRLLIQDPSCGGLSNAVHSQYWAFAATDPDEGLASLKGATTTPIRIDEVELHASRDGGAVRMLIRSPWGQADVEPGFHAQVGDAVLDTLAVRQVPIPEHEDFHPLFSGNHTWTWGPTGPGAGIVDVIASNMGSARAEAYLDFQVPANGNVTCSMVYPAEATCTTVGDAKESPAASAPLAVVAAVAAAVLLGRRRT